MPRNDYGNEVKGTSTKNGFTAFLLSLLLMLLRRFVPQLYYTAIWGESALFNTVFTLAFALIAAVLLLIPAVIVNRWFPFVLGRRRKARQPASR